MPRRKMIKLNDQLCYLLKKSPQPNVCIPDLSAPPPGWALGGAGPGQPPTNPIVGPGGMSQPPPQNVSLPPQRLTQIPPPRMPITSHHVPHPQMIQQPPPVQPNPSNFQVYIKILKFIFLTLSINQKL